MASLARAEDATSPPAPDKPLQITLGDDYGCPTALPVTSVPGGWFETDGRKRRIDCMLSGAQAELNTWRPQKPTAPPSQGFQLQVSHGVFSLISALITTELAVIKSRADQHCRAVANPFAHC